jgi:hypothetical protein
MLRTNLSTRPFYNDRAVRAVLLALAIVAAAATAFNAIRIITLMSSESTLGTNEASARREAARLRREATRIRSQINQEELDVVAAAAREANALIDRRAFSWTGLFTHFESTLPEDVRIRSVQPRLEQGVFAVTMTIEARRAEDVDAFIEALEGTGRFTDVLPLVQLTTEEGLLETTIEGRYAADPQPAGVAR